MRRKQGVQKPAVGDHPYWFSRKHDRVSADNRQILR